MNTLHPRIALALGWTVPEVRSFSLMSLREIVRPVNPKLAQEITAILESGRHLIANEVSS